MITCPNCLKKHNDGTHYCDECGFDLLVDINSLPKTVKTPEISDTDLNKEALSDSEETVENTEEGEELAIASDEDDYLNIDDEDDDMPYDRVKSKKKNSRKVRRFNKKKTIKVIAITMAALIFVSAALYVLYELFAEKPYPKYALYVKDGELMIQGFDANAPVSLPINVDDVVDFNLYGDLCRLSEDGTFLIFAQDYTYGDEVIDISYINLSIPNSAPVSIGYNALSYSVNKAMDTVTYLRASDDGNKLFRYTVYNGKRIQIDEGVNKFIACKDGESVLFYETDSGVHMYDGKKSVNLASSASIAWGADKNLYFFRDEEHEDILSTPLYYFDGSQSIKLIDDCIEVLYTNEKTYASIVWANDEDGDAIYYVVKNTATRINIEDVDFFVHNFWMDEDGKTMYFLDDVDENDSDDYTDESVAFEAILYKAKLTKKGIKEIVEIDEDVNDGFYIDKGKFIYTKDTEFDEEGVPTYDVYLNEEYVDNLVNTVICADGKDLFCMSNYDVYENTFSVYRNGKLVDHDIIETLMIDDEFMYIKESEYEDYYDLYDADGEIVVSEMYLYDTSFEDKVIFYTYWDEENECGTINLYENGKAQELSDDVFMYTVTLAGDLVYAEDVDSTYTGDIYYYRKGTEYRLAKNIDVSYLDIMSCIATIKDGNYVSVEEANWLADNYYE